MSVPCEASAASAPVQPVLNNNPLENTRILLADDTPDSARLFKLCLSSAGAHVQTFENGRDLLEFYLASGRDSCDAIMSDMRMPVLDGIAMTKKIRALGMRVPIVLHSSCSTDDGTRIVSDVGADLFIPKPFEHEMMIERLASLLALVASRKAA